jgi:tetratricopeptide (TPR) repeat protein
LRQQSVMRFRLGAGAATACAALALALSAAPARADGITDGNAGREALIAGKTDEAIQLLSRAITFGGLARPNQAVTLNLRGRAYLTKGQIEVALDDLNESLRLVDSADARFNRATIYLDQYRFDDAIADLTKAMALGGQGADVYAERGHAFVYTGQLDQALKDLDEAVRRQPNYGFAYRTRGHAYLNQNLDDKAIADETKAISLDPKDMEAYWLRAYAYRYRKKAIPLAIADYTKALAIDPSDSTNRTSRADAYEQTGRYDLAAADYDDWIRRNPKGPFGYWGRGRLNLVQGRNEAAAADLAKAVSLKPADAYDVLWLHIARLRTGVDDKAELTANAAKLDHAIWPAPLVSYFTGKATATEVLASAAKGEGAAKATQICEALIFLGQDDMAKGRKEDGVARLQTADRSCAADSQEAHLIKADLKKAGAPPRAILASTAAKPAAVAAAAPPIPRSKPQIQPQKQAQAAPGGHPLGLRGSLK